ncbi:MAG TPA: phosphoribosylamine--glycine ligase, partial [Actinomycetota bacterium]|nr:phosphoribosylamine--glycine ligase [Actinomycetota bacterium]
GDIPGIAEFAERESIDLTVVGPEMPLVAGLVDELLERGLAVFGPTRDGAMIEGSKAWARELCARHGIPGPAFGQFTDPAEAVAFLDRLSPPYVVKADGVAAGKGVTIAEDRASAEAAIADCLVERIFGDSGGRVVLEEHLTGTEVSAFALTDGKTVLPFSTAQDYKRALDGDRGRNTGGMGAYSPVPFVDDALSRQIDETILRATVAAMEEEGVRYRGVLYAGLMLTQDGPKVLEFNARFGDPETQVLVPRLESNIGELMLACVEGNLAPYRVTWKPEARVGVVLASEGYPGPHQTGKTITGLGDARAVEGVEVYHAGTVLRDGRVVTSGGRVLTVSAGGATLREARERAYAAVERIDFDGKMVRSDIAAGVGKGAE